MYRAFGPPAAAPATQTGRPEAEGLHPADLALLQAISRGEFALAGFRNRDLRNLLYPTRDHATANEMRRPSARVGRLLRLPRAHGVIHKIAKTHRYRVSPPGRLLTAGLFAPRSATLKQSMREAA